MAPHLIGESTLRSSRNRSRGTKQGRSAGHDAEDLQHQSELKTVGSRIAKTNGYECADDDGVSVGSDERMGAGWRCDRDSERGIVVKEDGEKRIRKTSSVVIESEVWEGGNGELRQSVTRVR